jgi:hypothetical protein
VNGATVFHGHADSIPPGNGQQFTIPKPFPATNTVIVKISSGQDPALDANPYMQFNTLTLS